MLGDQILDASMSGKLSQSNEILTLHGQDDLWGRSHRNVHSPFLMRRSAVMGTNQILESCSNVVMQVQELTFSCMAPWKFFVNLRLA